MSQISACKSIDVLEISEWQKGKIRELNINTLGELIVSKESDLMKAYQIGKSKIPADEECKDLVLFLNIYLVKIEFCT